MHGRSAKSLVEVLAKTDAVLQSGADAVTLGNELFGMVEILDREHVLRRALSETTLGPDAKSSLFHSVFEGKVSTAAFDIGDTAARGGWSAAVDLADALEQASVAAQVASADERGELDELEDDLFRFGRIVDNEPALREALSDPTVPVEGKRSLLRDLLGEKVDAAALTLLGQIVVGRHRSLTAAFEQYQQIAARRRALLVATAWVAAPISKDQRDRLTAALARQYGREVHLNVVVEPSVLGGVRVAVGDEVIDSTVNNRLSQAERQLS